MVILITPEDCKEARRRRVYREGFYSGYALFAKPAGIFARIQRPMIMYEQTETAKNRGADAPYARGFMEGVGVSLAENSRGMELSPEQKKRSSRDILMCLVSSGLSPEEAQEKYNAIMGIPSSLKMN